jgi:hypothetical protein
VRIAAGRRFTHRHVDFEARVRALDAPRRRSGAHRHAARLRYMRRRLHGGRVHVSLHAHRRHARRRQTLLGRRARLHEEVVASAEAKKCFQACLRPA